MRILCLFYDSAGGINVVNSLIYEGVRYWTKQFEDSAEVIYFSSDDASIRTPREAIANANPDVVITQDVFPNILQAMQESAVSRKISFLVSPLDKEESLYPSIQFMQLYRGEEHFDFSKQFHMPFDTTRWSISKPWKERRNFCYIGRFHQDKITPEAIDLGDIDTYGEENSSALYRYSVNKHTYKGTLSRGDVNLVLNNYKYHVLHTATDCFSLVSAEAMMSGTIPIIIPQPRYQLYPWSSWIPEGFGLRFNTFREFYQVRDELRSSDLTDKAKKESCWIKAFHNQPNFAAHLDRVLRRI